MGADQAQHRFAKPARESNPDFVPPTYPFDQAEANRIILAWGPFEPRTSVLGSWKGCRAETDSGFTCSRLAHGDTCGHHSPRKAYPPRWVENTWIYFVRAGDAVKIGHTSRLTARMAALRHGSPVKTELIRQIAGAEALEYWLHMRFHKDRRHGEWFDFSDDIQQFLELDDETIWKITGMAFDPVAYARWLPYEQSEVAA